MSCLLLPFQCRYMLLCMLCGVVLISLAACAPRKAKVPHTPTPVMLIGADDAPQSPTVEASDSLPMPELLARALERRAIGDHEGAAADLTTFLEQYPDVPETRQARYYLAESFAQRGRWTSAQAAFQAFLEAPTQDAYTTRALFWLARCYEEMGDWSSAAATYERYRAHNTVLEPYAAIRQAALQHELNQQEEAAQNFVHAASSDIQPAERAASYERAIALRLQMGQEQEALRLYEELLALASLPTYRARILTEAATLAQQLGQTEQAHRWLRDVVAVAPESAQAVAAVEQLRAAGAPNLSAADAARVLFTTGYYQDALPLLDEAIAQAPADSDEALELRRLRALSRRALGQFPEALDELAAVAQFNRDSEPVQQARLDWIQTLGQSGEVEQAAQRYYDYAQTYSEDWRAPVALDRSAQLYARLGNIERAMQVRVELGRRYPQTDQAAAALNVAGWYYYGAGRTDEARQAWELLTGSSEGYERARGAFWAGRIAASQGDAASASRLFELARTAAPNSYYGVRAAEEQGITLQGAVPLGAPISEDEWRALATWVDGWSGLPASYDSLPDVRSSGFVQRAVALRQVGLSSEAMAEWNSARTEWGQNPARLLWLARAAHENTTPYIALKAAEQIALQTPQEARPLPETLERLIFPTPYAALVAAEASAQGVDPRLFYALLRQESHFNPDATSWVGARGLAQVMPSTGEGIAQDLGMPAFQPDDLYRPQVSIRFGTYYIGRRIDDMQGSIHGGLAAYNGGLGNALRWADGNTVTDPDLFTEYIDFPETEGYVKLVYGYYGAYRRLYSWP